MRASATRAAQFWMALGPRLLPFADAASDALPLPRLLRLSLFQVSVGMAIVLLNGTLNRVMIVELGVPASLVALMIALPVAFAPLRALIGFRSDQHRSYLGWRRVPYIWFGTLLQFGGLAIMPFALILLSGDTTGPLWVGQAAAALAFLLVGAGMHTSQTAGIALATDLAPEASRPRVVALLYVMLLFGTLGSAFLFSVLLREFSQILLIQVIQGAALATLVINVLSLWRQEPRRPDLTRHDLPRQPFRAAWSELVGNPVSRRLLIAVGCGSAAFSMQDVLLEPFGAEVLGLAVSETTLLTGVFACGSLLAFALAGARLHKGTNVFRLCGIGLLAGVIGFTGVIFAAPLSSTPLFCSGVFAIGVGTGLFSVGTLVAAMEIGDTRARGLTLGAWGGVQATAIGIGIGVGGILRDITASLAASGVLGSALSGPEVGYSVVYHIEILLLFATLVIVGPLVGLGYRAQSGRIGLAGMPG